MKKCYLYVRIANEVLMTMRASKRISNEVSLEESIGTDKEGNNMTFSDILQADTDDISDIIALKIDIKKLHSAMSEVLTNDEKNILCWRYGLLNEKRKTQKEVSDILGISRSYVSRIEKKAIKKLAEKLKE